MIHTHNNLCQTRDNKNAFQQDAYRPHIDGGAGGGGDCKRQKKKMTQTPYTVCELYWEHIIHRNCRVKIFDIYKVSEFDIKWYIFLLSQSYGQKYILYESSTIFDPLNKKKIWIKKNLN